MKTTYIILIVFSAIRLEIVAQNNCYLKLDKAKIIYNKNLDDFLVLLQKDSFIIDNNKKEIPSFIMEQLNCITGSFTMANPDEEYQCCCDSPDDLPERQLQFLAKSNDLLVMTYLTGGIGVNTHILLVKFENQKILDIWTGCCLQRFNSTKGLYDFIIENRDKKWGLNTNYLTL